MFQNATHRLGRGPRAARPIPKLRVEGLEDRVVPSAWTWLTGGWVERPDAPKPQISMNSSGTVVVLGTDRGDAVTLDTQPADRLGPNRLVVRVAYDQEMERDGFWATGSYQYERRTAVREFPLPAGAAPPPVYVDAKKGDDTLTNRTGARVTALGGEGNDTLVGGAAGDFLFGGVGMDVLRGGGGNDLLAGDFDSPDLTGQPRPGEMRDTLEGGLGFDYLIGGGGSDDLWGGVQLDFADAAPDDGDFLVGDYLSNTFGGTDTIHGGRGSDVAYGGEGVDVIAGGPGDDTLIGGRGQDTIGGGVGNDTIHTGFVSDQPAADLQLMFIDFPLFLRLYTDPVFRTPGLNAAQVQVQTSAVSGDPTWNRDVSRDFAFGNEDNDTINTSGGGDVADGGTGRDTLNGSGDSVLSAGVDADVDTLNGVSGDQFQNVQPNDRVSLAFRSR